MPGIDWQCWIVGNPDVHPRLLKLSDQLDKATLMSESSDIIYKVNNRDELCFVNQAFDEFASANSGPTSASGTLLARPVWDFVTDSTTRHLYRDLLKRVRDGRPIRFTFRCDSPTCRRLMEMNMNRVDDDLIEFRVRTISEENRPAEVLLEPSAARSDLLLRLCAWCKKVHLDDVWVEVEEATARLRLFEQPLLPSMTHGICEPCRRTMTGVATS